MPDVRAPGTGDDGPTLHTCPDCGGILEATHPRWRSLVQSLQAEPPRTSPERGGGWQCLLCGYKKA